MGGSESGHLAIQLETPSVPAGQELSGVIHFQVKSPIQASSLSLKLSGKEWCRWVTGSGKNRRTHFGRSTVTKHIFPIFMFQDSQVNPGDYSFPFNIHTPENLPSTIDFNGGSTQAHLNYSLSAFLNDAKAKVGKSKVGVNVTGRMREQIVRVEADVMAAMRVWCCLRRGVIRLNASVDKSAYRSGETIHIRAEVNNSQSLLAVRGIKARMNRIIGLQETRGLINSSAQYEFPLTQEFFARPIQPGATNPEVCQFTLRVHEPQHVTTYKGNVINCWYMLTIEVEMAGICMCCGQTPVIRQTLTVYPAQVMPAVPELQAPLGWNPTLMPMTQLTCAVIEEQPKQSAS